jgi:hypothetical protein
MEISSEGSNRVGSYLNAGQKVSLWREDCRSNNMELKKWKYLTRQPASIPTSHRSSKSFHPDADS